VLPDFPDAKDHARRMFLRAVREQVPQHEPLLRGIRHTRIHEGRTARLTRADQSTDKIALQQASAELTIKREQMRRVTIDQLLEQVATMADQLAGHQVQLMFSRISEAVEEVGNAVSAAEMGTKEAFLQSQRRLEVEFDPVTLEPKNLVMVLHPDQVERFKAQADEWEKDPAFVAEMDRIRKHQIEDWRARENRRKLVD
jgi:hypothetical protein